MIHTYSNKNAFQPKSRLPLADRKLNTYNLTLVWPWTHLWLWPQTSQTKLNWCPSSKIRHFPWDDLDPMTLILILNLDMVNIYHHTKNQVPMSNYSKVVAQTDTYTHRDWHTDRCTDTTKTRPLRHTREVTKYHSLLYFRSYTATPQRLDAQPGNKSWSSLCKTKRKRQNMFMTLKQLPLWGLDPWIPLHGKNDRKNWKRTSNLWW